MNGLSDYLDTLSEADPALAELLDTYKEIAQVFDSANAAVNLPAKVQPQDNNTAKVTISFQQSPLSSMGGASPQHGETSRIPPACTEFS